MKAGAFCTEGTDMFQRIVARIDAWASVPGAGGASEALLDVGRIARAALKAPPPVVTGLSQEEYDALVRDAMLWRTHECEVGL